MYLCIFEIEIPMKPQGGRAEQRKGNSSRAGRRKQQSRDKAQTLNKQKLIMFRCEREGESEGRERETETATARRHKIISFHFTSFLFISFVSLPSVYKKNMLLFVLTRVLPLRVRVLQRCVSAGYMCICQCTQCISIYLSAAIFGHHFN